MLKFGDKTIGKLYYMDKAISKAYLGDKLVFQANKPILLDYIESDGGQYLIVPYRVNNKTQAYIRYNQTAGGPQVASAVIGVTSGPSVNQANYGLLRLLNGTGRYNRVGWGDSTTGSVKDIFGYNNFNTWYEVFYDLNKIYIDGNLIATSETSTNKEWSAKYDLGIFARNGNSVTMPTPAKVSRVYAKEDGKYVLDLYPCLDSKGVACMYDMVSKQYYYNKGTGEFKAGNRLIFYNYVEFDGNSWIDTGYKPNSNTMTSVIYYPYAYSNFQCIFGTQDSGTDNRFYGLISSTNYKVQINSSSLNSSFLGISNSNLINGNNGTFTSKQQLVTLAIDNYNKQVDVKSEELIKSFKYGTDNFYAADLAPNCSYNLILGNRSTAGTCNTANAFRGKIYKCIIKESDELVRDFRPCMVAGTIGMYDMVTGKLYTNANASGGVLSTQYKFVSSITFDGKSYIDSGIQTGNNICMEIDAKSLSGVQYHAMGYFNNKSTEILDCYAIFGSSEGNIQAAIGFSTNRIKATDYTWYNERHYCKLDRGKLYVDGTYIDEKIPQLDAYHNIWVGGINNIALHKGIVYSAKISDGDTGIALLDLRPCIDKDNVPCFLDILTGTPYYNAGTGILTTE